MELVLIAKEQSMSQFDPTVPFFPLFHSFLILKDPNNSNVTDLNAFTLNALCTSQVRPIYRQPNCHAAEFQKLMGGKVTQF